MNKARMKSPLATVNLHTGMPGEFFGSFYFNYTILLFSSAFVDLRHISSCLTFVQS